MKTLTFIIGFILPFSLSACSGNFNSSEVRNLKDFNGIEVGGGINVYLTQGKEYYVEVIAEEKILEEVKTEVSGDVLKIFRKNSSWFNWSSGSIKVYVTTPSVEYLSSSGGSNVYGENNFNSSDIVIRSSGGSDIKISVNANNVEISSSGGADVHISGTAEFVKASSSGGSDINCYDLVAKTAELHSSGGSDIQMTVTEELDARSSGGSDIYYKGNPEKVHADSSGGSDVHKR